jgi:peptidoglycan biosynthesis protein MviN/MurJ (putative lipid II flippase)
VGVQIPSAMRDGFFTRIPRIYVFNDLVETMIVSLPRALALSMTQVEFIGLIALAGLLVPGSIAIFTFAYNLQAVPLAIIGASYSAFPALAAALARNEKAEFIAHIATAARLIFFWSLPAIALIIVLRAHAVRLILGSGQFNWTDTKLTAAAFALLSLSLAAQGLALLLTRGYYAAGRTFVPFVISSLSAVATIVLAALFVGVWHSPMLGEFSATLLRVDQVPGKSVLALAFAYAIANIGEAIALTLLFENRFPGFIVQVRRAWSQSALVAIITGTAAYVTLNVVGVITFSSTVASVFLHGFAGGLVGVIVSALTYRMLGSREYFDMARMLTTQVRKSGILKGLLVTDATEEHVQ